MSRPDQVLDEIASLLASPEREDDAARLERVLTDGYARVLTLETDRMRLDKQIAGLVARPTARGARGQLRLLSQRRERRTQDIGRLREELAQLRRRYSLAAGARS